MSHFKTEKRQIAPFDEEKLPFDVSKHCWIEFSEGKAYSVLLSHIAKSSIAVEHNGISQAGSFGNPEFSNVKQKCHDYYDSDEEIEDDKEKSEEGIEMQVGLGLFAIETFEESKTTMYALHQSIGDPVGTNCGIQTLKTLTVFTEGLGNEMIIAKFTKQLIDKSERTNAFFFKTYKWHARHEYWRPQGVCRARDMDSVVLPAATKSKIIEDVDRFLKPETQKFYQKHGIPFRRSYLFYGIPGAGKTSVIQALAGKYKRNVSFLQLTDKEMTDDGLLTSIARLNKNTIVVIEDVDSCFAGRSNKIAHSQITFTGLLNALDGVSSSSGQIFILTTNLKDQLDPALIRCGRVDVQVEFHPASDEQLILMWHAFYPDYPEKVQPFVTAVRACLAGKGVNTASLQHFFVVNMHSTPEEAIGSIAHVFEDMEFLEVIKKDDEAKETLRKEKEAADEAKAERDESEEE